MGASEPERCREASDVVAQIRELLAHISRRERLALAAQVLLTETEGCDYQLGVLLKALALDDADGNPLVDALADKAGGANESSKSTRLSRRRQETLNHLMRGLSEKEVAARMKLARHTVHEHVKAIYRLMRVHSRSELLSTVFKRSGASSGRSQKMHR